MPVVAHSAKPLLEAAPATEWTACTGGANICEQGLAPTKSSTKGEPGFTLIELLVVLAIASLLIGLVPVAYSKMRESAQYRDHLRQTLAELRAARQSAISTGISATWQVQLGTRQQGLQGQAQRMLPPGLQVRATVGQQQLKQGTASIVFLPSGGATGGSVEYIRTNGEGTRLRIDWFSGQITQERLLP